MLRRDVENNISVIEQAMHDVYNGQSENENFPPFERPLMYISNNYARIENFQQMLDLEYC